MTLFTIPRAASSLIQISALAVYCVLTSPHVDKNMSLLPAALYKYRGLLSFTLVLDPQIYFGMKVGREVKSTILRSDRSKSKQQLALG